MSINNFCRLQIFIKLIFFDLVPDAETAKLFEQFKFSHCHHTRSSAFEDSLLHKAMST